MTDGAPDAIAPAELTPGVFTTSGFPTARRVELWESHNAAALIGLTVRAPDSLDAAEVNVQLPRARMARVTGSAHSVERTRDLILRCPADSVAVFLTLRGESRFTADGVALERRRGDALAWDADRPFTRTFAQGLEELVVTIPWAELIARSQSPNLMAGPVITSFGAPTAPGPARSAGVAAAAGPPGTARAPGAAGPTASAGMVPSAGSEWSAVSGRSAGEVPSAGLGRSAGLEWSAGSGRPDPYARALARIADRATRTERPLRPDERTVLDLVAAIVGGPRAAPAAAHRAAARSYIEERLTDPGLCAAEIAAAAGISERQLSRLFAADGSSVPRHILSRRLQLAHSILSATSAPDRARAGAGSGSRAGAAPTVADVAASCGFTSVTYFSHAFRDHFGHRAGDLRLEGTGLK
jgi:AraC-like DNA-binding protein